MFRSVYAALEDLEGFRTLLGIRVYQGFLYKSLPRFGDLLGFGVLRTGDRALKKV